MPVENIMRAEEDRMAETSEERARRFLTSWMLGHDATPPEVERERWEPEFLSAMTAEFDAIRDEAMAWSDQEDEWSGAISDAHPICSGAHKEYAMAMQMVGHRHSKGELVDLVTWLLVEKRKSAVAAKVK